MRDRREMWVILQCTDVSQAAEHSFSQVCDLIVTQVETLQETETRKHPILQTTQVIERQIPGNQTHTHKHALHSENKDWPSISRKKKKKLHYIITYRIKVQGQGWSHSQFFQAMAKLPGISSNESNIVLIDTQNP